MILIDCNAYIRLNQVKSLEPGKEGFGSTGRGKLMVIKKVIISFLFPTMLVGCRPREITTQDVELEKARIKQVNTGERKLKQTKQSMKLYLRWPQNK